MFKNKIENTEPIKEGEDKEENKKLPIGVLERTVTFEVEGKEVEVKFRFAAHGKAGDVEGLEEDLKNADVFVPEYSLWDEELLKEYNKASRENMNDEKIKHISLLSNFPEYFAAQLKALSGKKVKVLFADIPNLRSTKNAEELKLSHEYYINRENVQNRRFYAIELFRQGKFELSVYEYGKFIEACARAQKDREDFIAKNLEEKIKELVNGGEFSDKKNIKVLVGIGSGHVAIVPKIKYNVGGTIKNFAGGNGMYLFVEYLVEHLRRRIFVGGGLENLLIARSLFQDCLLRLLLSGFSKNVYEGGIVEKFIIDKLSYEQIKSVCEAKEGWINKTDEFLNKYNLAVPKSEKEFNELLEHIHQEEERKYGGRRSG